MMIVGKVAHSRRTTGMALEKQQPLTRQKFSIQISEATRNECCEDIIVIWYIDYRTDGSKRSSSRKLSSYRYCGEDKSRRISM